MVFFNAVGFSYGGMFPDVGRIETEFIGFFCGYDSLNAVGISYGGTYPDVGTIEREFGFGRSWIEIFPSEGEDFLDCCCFSIKLKYLISGLLFSS